MALPKYVVTDELPPSTEGALPFRMGWLDGVPYHVERSFIPDPGTFAKQVEEESLDGGAEWFRNQSAWRMDIWPSNNPGLYQLFEELMLRVNSEHFGFDLDHWRDLRLLRYAEGSRGMKSHMDYDYTPHKACDKLTFSVTLQLPVEGNGLRLSHSAGFSGPAPVDVGDVIIYPGFQVHSVGQVHEGERIALVGSLGGPPFR